MSSIQKDNGPRFVDPVAEKERLNFPKSCIFLSGLVSLHAGTNEPAEVLEPVEPRSQRTQYIYKDC